MNDNSNTVFALIAGLAAGAALGVLFAPERGADTREKLNDSLKDLGEAIKERSAEPKDQFNEFKEKIVSPLKGKINRRAVGLDEEGDGHAGIETRCGSMAVGNLPITVDGRSKVFPSGGNSEADRVPENNQRSDLAGKSSAVGRANSHKSDRH